MGKQKPINSKKVNSNSFQHTQNKNIIEQPYHLLPSELNKIINEILSEHQVADKSNKKAWAKHNKEDSSKAKKHIYRRARMSKSFQEEVTSRILKEREATSQLQITKPNRQSQILQTKAQTITIERVAQLELTDKTNVRKWVDTLEKASDDRSPSEITI